MAIVDIRKLPDKHEIEVDLCIIGSGAAGITLASEWLGGPSSVAVLESGGLELDDAIQELNEGQLAGLSYAKLEKTWLRMFGGTTNHWTALVEPMERNTFEPRPWVPHSGWPISRADLEPFYDRARHLVKLPEGAFDVAHWTSNSARKRAPWNVSSVETKMLHWLPKSERPFGKLWRAALEKDNNVHVYLYATVLEIVADPSARTVAQLALGSLDGKRFTARAKSYILAAGGIENPRILLQSRSVEQNGLGNQNDLVGRFFSNHRTAHWARLHPSRPDLDPNFYRMHSHSAGIAHPALTLSEQLQARYRVPNLRFGITPPAKARRRKWLPKVSAAMEPSALDRTIAQVIADVDSMTPSTSPSPTAATPPEPILVKAPYESFPNPNSRIRLGQRLDSFGQNRVVLDWRVADDEEHTVFKGFLALAAQLGAAGIGRLQIPSGGLVFSQHSYHHMGTTRMHDDPHQGVVDSNCRVHGVDNLFIAGSSVFPTYGACEPTFTIIALAFRLSDHLKRLVRAA